MDKSAGVPARYATAHKSPKGADDARPSAEQVLQDEGLIDKLQGKTILITGGSSGLGAESARVLYQTGAKIIIAARQAAKAEKLAKSISTNASRPLISVIEMSLDSFDSIRAGVKQFLSHSKQLNVLLTNAGVMASPEGQTQDGFETQFGTNHLGHFLLFQLLKPTLLASSTPDFNSRVVSLSSSGHRMSSIEPKNYNLKGNYDPWKAYGQSKTANVFFANEVTRRYGKQGLQGLSLHPGAITDTELSRHTKDDATLKEAIHGHPQFNDWAKSTPQGAATQVWACISKDLEGKGGLFLDDVQVAPPVADDAAPFHPGYAPHAYDAEAAKKLWVDSLKMIGMEDDA